MEVGRAIEADAARELIDLRIEDVDPHFRAVGLGDERRGIRLERFFWETLQRVAADRNASVGEIVSAASLAFPTTSNLTSVLRVLCLKWLSKRLEKAEQSTSMPRIQAIVQASPSPAFVIAADKKILFHNQSFLSFIQQRFASADSSMMAKGLKLSFDVQIDQLLQTLGDTPGTPAIVGFALGIENQRVRGKLNTVLAPISSKQLIIAFVSNV